MTFSKQIPATITTNNVRIPNTPDFSFTNPLKKNMFVNGVEIVCTPEFSRKGVIIIAVDNNILFDSRDTKGFVNVAFMPVNLNAVFERDRIVTVSAFNQVDTNEIEVTINVFVDEVERTLNSALQYFSQDVVNKAVSDTEILFEFIARGIGTFTQLLDMKGYQKLIVNISAKDYISPTVLLNEYPLTNPTNAVDGNLSSSTGIFGGSGLTDGAELNFSIEFDEIQTGLPTAKIQSRAQRVQAGQTGTLTTELFSSLNGIDFTLLDTLFQADNSNSPIVTNTLQGTLTSWKFLKITTSGTNTLGNTNTAYQLGIFELYDSNAIGGTAELSFDELDVANNLFTEFISSAEFGTVTQSEAVKTQIGDVNNLSITGRAYALPSTQTGLRAKLIVTGGGIETGVAIRRVV